MEEKKKHPDDPIQEHSWTPPAHPSAHSIHSKLDWIDEVHFRYVRGVEVHPEVEASLHQESV